MYGIADRLRLVVRDSVFAVASLPNRVRMPAEPILLCNSYPKSGTHLLAQILLGFDGVRIWDSLTSGHKDPGAMQIVATQSLSGIMNSESHVRWKLASAPGGALVSAHLVHAPEVLRALSVRPASRFFIYRDLRDVAVSHANWVRREARYYLHPFYAALPDFDACLMASIKGVPAGIPFGSNASQAHIGTDFRRWQGWLSDPETLAVRFEDLVGERGGGNEQARLDCVRRIAAHLGRDLDDEALAAFGSRAMNPEKSHTFRKGNKGAIGTWRERFTPAHKQAFKQVAGDLLVELGYERDLDW